MIAMATGIGWDNFLIVTLLCNVMAVTQKLSQMRCDDGENGHRWQWPFQWWENVLSVNNDIDCSASHTFHPARKNYVIQKRDIKDLFGPKIRLKIDTYYIEYKLHFSWWSSIFKSKFTRMKWQHSFFLPPPSALTAMNLLFLFKSDNWHWSSSGRILIHC